MREIVLATGNPAVKELQELLAPLAWQVRPQSEWQLSDAEETGLTFVENAIIKARHAALHTGLPALADDSGLAVDAYTELTVFILPDAQLTSMVAKHPTNRISRNYYSN